MAQIVFADSAAGTAKVAIVGAVAVGATIGCASQIHAVAPGLGFYDIDARKRITAWADLPPTYETMQ
jgi:hypothetical protein